MSAEHSQHSISLPPNQRLDVALTTALGHQLSRSQVQKLIEQGKVTVDGVVITRASFKSKETVQVILTLPETKPAVLVPAPEIGLNILYQDEFFAVIEKPTGLTVHPGIGTGNDTLVHALLARFPDLPDNAGTDRPGIVHRLDRDTRGLMLVARTPESHRRLAEQFSQRKIRKIYHALLWGNPGISRRISGYIRRHPKKRRLMQFILKAEGRARAAALVLNPLATAPPFTLAEIDLETGRTHQIRATCTALGTPVVGDQLYGDQEKLCRRYKVGKARRMALGALGLCLQASRLEFQHPFHGDKMLFELPIPAEWQAANLISSHY